MIITNHILAGSIIGLAVTQPILAVVIALGSHFAMDAVPHFGYEGRKGYQEVLKHKLSYVVAGITLFSTIVIILLLALHGQWFAIAIGLVAASPDVLGVYNWLAYEKHGKQATGFLKLVHVKFHRGIQWCERPWGVVVEVVIFIGLGGILLRML